MNDIQNACAGAGEVDEEQEARVSPALISRVTDVVTEEITAWQTRPLDGFYAILYIDALVVKVRDGGAAGQQGRLPGHRRGHRRVQARAGHLDRRL